VGVHLSWWDFLTAEGTIVDLGERDVTMLHNWAVNETSCCAKPSRPENRCRRQPVRQNL
jgi:hypothetical protein